MRKYITTLLLVFLLCLSQQHCFAEYLITETQVATLESRLEKLNELNNANLNDLMTLQTTLKLLQTENAQQAKSLQSVKQYCEKLERNQSKKVLNEYTFLLGTENTIAGAGYGKYFRLGSSCRYIGFRLDYDWHDREAGVWVSYLH